ncbi:uncharacterized protein Z518_01483 [Rhinocladiella mackenziei CBS 650.93]|uniref:Phosphatidylinositol transfer protein SFH5 n=1 Tax=Rhinocladiella mackenziei CBS 650.93 TaxID=1442369 RepID=A0A0D2J3W0_9EURO|nr:uncharacterized protein Z518_01483 [Rhinocladiella mackenziei CBS 650.93]KIX10401.1 hypothetical protein Z518_01483 [Rhinocladiella mackenziei CBS 650.93]
MTANETTAAPTSTTLLSEVSGVVPDVTPTELKVVNESTPPTETGITITAIPEQEAAKEADRTEITVTKPTPPIEDLWAAAKSHGHPEIWGVYLKDPANDIPTQIILQKFLNANDGDLAKSKDQLTKTLDWRAKIKPLELTQKKFNRHKFNGLGYVSTFGAHDTVDPELKEVITWNIYGSVKNVEETFGDLQEFLEWRVVLMEAALASLGIQQASKTITADYDPYKIVQVHDYKSISFLRQSPVVKAASTETIKIFAQNYPELLKEKFFVNVPAIMGFIYAFMKLFVAPKTIKKFHPMSDGANLAKEIAANSNVKGLQDSLPVAYGGKGAELENVGKQPDLQEPESVTQKG